MYFDGSSNGSFRAPYYRSSDYQTRYPAYLRPVAAPPPVTVNSQSSLYPRWYGVRKMATTLCRSEVTKPVGFSDSIDLKPTATTAKTSKKRKSAKKQRRQSRKVAVIDGLDHECSYPSPPPVDEDHSFRVITSTPISPPSHSSSAEDHSLRDITHTSLSLASHSPSAKDYCSRSYHTLLTHISNPLYLSDSCPTSTPSPSPSAFPLSPLPSTTPTYQTIHTDLSPQRRRAGEEDHPLQYLKTSSIVPPPPPTPPPPPPPLPANEDDFPPRGFTPTNIYFQTPLPPPPADEEDNVCTNINLPTPHASGDSPLHPVELLKRTAKRFKLECERRHRTSVIQNEKAQARNIAEQAKQVVTAAKRGWSYDADHRKGVTWTDDEEPSAFVRLPEYAELERLGLGKYDSDGYWVPSSTRLKNRFLGLR